MVWWDQTHLQVVSTEHFWKTIVEKQEITKTLEVSVFDKRQKDDKLIKSNVLKADDPIDFEQVLLIYVHDF